MLFSQYNELRKSAVMELPKVRKFLESIERNSKSSKVAYCSGLTHFNNFIIKDYASLNLNAESILERLLLTNNEQINVYELLDSFVSYILKERKGISPKSVSLYVTAIRSYMAYYDIDVLPSKFKRKVKMPKFYREDEEAVDATDIRKILLCCNNRRLKTLILILASGGMRVVEALATRYMDIDFTVSPTKLHIRKEYTKTKRARDIYISDEATSYLKQWLDWKHNNPNRTVKWELNKGDLVFKVHNRKAINTDMKGLYNKVEQEFNRVLAIAKMDARKGEEESENNIITADITATTTSENIPIPKRRKITIHTLRRFTKTIISDQAGKDYSEWFLGHEKSSYWTKKEAAKREIYATKAMKYLTILDYQILETTGKNIETKLTEKDIEIQYLRQRDLKHEAEIQQMKQEWSKVTKALQYVESFVSTYGTHLGSNNTIEDRKRWESIKLLEKMQLENPDFVPERSPISSTPANHMRKQRRVSTRKD